MRDAPGLDVWIGFPAAAAAEHENSEIQRLLWLSIFAVGEGQRVR